MTMGIYRPLFNISVKHDFYADGLCPCLDFVPSEQTQQIINNTGLLVRKSVSGIGVIYDQARNDALVSYVENQEEPLCFEFKVYSTDPQLRSYTEPFSAHPEGSMLYFDNRAEVSLDNQNIRLHASEYASNISFNKLESPQLIDVLSQKDRLIPPLFVVRIYAAGQVEPLFSVLAETAEKNYYLNFKSRQTFWKYYLLGSMARKNAYILDPDGEFEFEFTGETSLSDSRSALTFRSRVAIPLRQRQNFRFQLKEKSPEGERVLIKRLPVAGTAQFGKEVLSEQKIVVSEIYINC